MKRFLFTYLEREVFGFFHSEVSIFVTKQALFWAFLSQDKKM